MSRQVCHKCLCTFDEDTDECGCIEDAYLVQIRIYHGFPYEHYWQINNKKISPKFDLKTDALYWAKENLDENRVRINW
jgi:hypothetical protein